MGTEIFGCILILCAICAAQSGVWMRASPAAVASASWASVQHVMGDATNEAATCGGTGATCLVPITVSSGHYLAFHAVTNNNVTISSISAGGSLTLCTSSGCAANNGSNYVDAAHVLSSSSTTNITVTFSGAHGHAVVNIRDYSCSGGTISFDTFGGGNHSGGGGTTVTGITPTLSGTNDVITQESGDTSQDVSSVASPFGNLDISPADGSGTGGVGFADNLNTSSATPPTWTLGGSSTSEAQNVLAAKCQ